jgi:hypothetical protein
MLKYPKEHSLEHFISWFKDRFVPVLKIATSIIEHTYNVPYTKSYKLKEKQVAEYKSILGTTTNRLNLQNAPPFIMDITEPEELPVKTNNVVSKVKTKVAKTMRVETTKNVELASVDTKIIEHKSSLSSIKKFAKSFILPYRFGAFLARKAIGPSKFTRVRMKLYGIPSDKIKAGIKLEREFNRKLTDKTKIGDIFVKSVVKELGFDLDIKEQVAYIHTWLKYVFAPMFITVDTILKTNDYSYADINDLPDILEKHILRHLEKIKGELKEYKEFIPTMESYLRYTSIATKQRKGADINKNSYGSARGVSVTKALTGKSIEDNFVKSVDKFNSIQESYINKKFRNKIQETTKESNPIVTPVPIQKTSNNKDWLTKSAEEIKKSNEIVKEEETSKPLLQDQLAKLDDILTTLKGIHEKTGDVKVEVKSQEHEKESSSFYFNKTSDDIQKDLIKSIQDLVATLGGEQKQSAFEKLFSQPMAAKKSQNTIDITKKEVIF